MTVIRATAANVELAIWVPPGFIPAGLSLVSMYGTDWVCPTGGNTSTRSDPLMAGASYPPITVKVNVATNAPASVTNHVSVSGGQRQRQ